MLVQGNHKAQGLAAGWSGHQGPREWEVTGIWKEEATAWEGEGTFGGDTQPACGYPSRRKLGKYIPFVILITCLVYINITYQGTRGHRTLWLSFLQISLLWHRAGWTRVGGTLEKQRKGIQPNVQNSTCEDVCRRDFLGLIFIERVVWLQYWLFYNFLAPKFAHFVLKLKYT